MSIMIRVWISRAIIVIRTWLSSFAHSLSRRKHVDLSEETSLRRVLTTFDLILLGIGSTLGAGVYVVAGQVAMSTAGPAVVLSFLVAAIASVFAGICYAEFAARVPKAGSAYVYSYVAVGEFVAFVIGWNLILEYVIGASSMARAWSTSFDTLIDKKIQHFFNSTMHMDVSGLSEYPDFFAFGINFLLTVLLAAGVKESTKFNNALTFVNLLVIIYVCVCGLFKLDIKNWNIPEDELPDNKKFGTGGFMPFGFSGMMSGAATCFYAFVGFDCVATTGEEAKNPQRAIPMSIVISLLAITGAYCALSIVLTLICPYYLLDYNSPIPLAFHRFGWDVAKYIIAIGSICGMTTSLLGAMFPLPRILYAMGNDGLIYKFLGKVVPRFQTPVVGTMISGVFAGGMAMMFNISELVNMMSIGTLLAYTLVAICVLLLRYQPDENLPGYVRSPEDCDQYPTVFRIRDLVMPSNRDPTKLSGRITSFTVGAMLAAITAFCAVIVWAEKYLAEFAWWAILLSVMFGLSALLCVFVIWRQPQNKCKLSFKVPFLPFVPALSSLINIYLMMKLPVPTWERFGIWMAIGFLIYFTYGMWHSSADSDLACADKSSSVTSASEEDDELWVITKTRDQHQCDTTGRGTL